LTEDCDVVIATCCKAATLGRTFDVVIIDEATQASHTDVVLLAL
jgi:superfamily I DNA and/or RNA helicase